MTTLLEIKDLTVKYKNVKNNKASDTIAVNNLSLKIQEGEIYAVAGESGCGKSTLAKAVTKLVKPVCGEILYRGKSIYDIKDYPQKVQMVFQNPYASLNPKMKIGDILQEPLDINTKLSKADKKESVYKVVEEVGLSKNCLELYPHEFSGGQRQRIAIARALILNPELLIADEPVSALDASIQAQILNMLKNLKYKRNLTVIFISHDLNVINYISDRTGIMYFGNLIEENYTGTVFRYPEKDYTKILLNSIPMLQK